MEIQKSAKPLVVLEGTHGAGKTTVAKILSKELKAILVSTPPEEYEPIRYYMHTSAPGISRYLYYLSGIADVMDGVEQKRETSPLIIDRYFFSSIAGVVVDFDLDPKELLAIRSSVSKYIPDPDLTYHLSVRYSERIRRVEARDKREPKYKTNLSESRIYRLERIQKELLSEFRCKFIDTTNLSVEAVVNLIKADINEYAKQYFG